MEALDIVSRVVHVATAIVVLGGSIFIRFVLMPAAALLPEEEHRTLRHNIMGTWKVLVMIGVVLFLGSGFYNYLVVSLPNHRGDSPYNALMGIKILLAFGIFFLLSALTGRAPAFEGIRNNSKLWLNITILLGVLVVAIAGYLKVAQLG